MNYQEKVSTRADVRALYERVKENPAIKQYRGYTETKSYGWSDESNDYVKCEGEVWFDNPTYDAEFVTVGEGESVNAELLDEQLTARDARIAELEQQCAELCALLEEQNARMEQAENEATAARAECERVSAVLAALREAFLTLRRFIEA